MEREREKEGEIERERDRERERKGEGVERGAKVKRVKGAPNTMAHNQ